jgi:cytochrome c oxidase assembly protein subunit 11
MKHIYFYFWKRYVLIRFLAIILIILSSTFVVASVHSHLCDAIDIISWIRSFKLLTHIGIEHTSTSELTVNFIQESKSAFYLDVLPKIASTRTIPGHNSMLFLRIENKDSHPIVGIAINAIDPAEASFYFYKVLCFCYNDYVIFNNTSVDYPILFNISKELLSDPLLKNVKTINVIYSFYDYKHNAQSSRTV